MGFETKVLNVVETITDGAHFYCGTMCIPDICEDTALVVLQAVKDVVLCDVKMNCAGNEYLFDFV